MPARVVVFGGDSVSCISTELNTVGTLEPLYCVLPTPPFLILHPSFFGWGRPSLWGMALLVPSSLEVHVGSVRKTSHPGLDCRLHLFQLRFFYFICV